MKKLEIEIVEKGLQVDTLSRFLPNTICSMTDEEMDAIYGGTVGCSCKFHKCDHCNHVECLKLCKNKIFGDNTTKTTVDSTATVHLL